MDFLSIIGLAYLFEKCSKDCSPLFIIILFACVFVFISNNLKVEKMLEDWLKQFK